MRIKKKSGFLAVLLALCIVMTMMPVTVFAGNEDETQDVGNETVQDLIRDNEGGKWKVAEYSIT